MALIKFDGGTIKCGEGLVKPLATQLLVQPPTKITALMIAKYGDSDKSANYTLSNGVIIECTYTSNNNTIQVRLVKEGEQLAITQTGGGIEFPHMVSIVHSSNDKYYLVTPFANSVTGTITNRDVIGGVCDSFGDVLVNYSISQPQDITQYVLDSVIEDENEQDGTSGVGGGGGNFDNDSDSIGVPSLPSLNLLNSSAISVYNLSTSNLSNLSSFLFSNDFVDNIKKLFNNPIENILNLCIAPITNDVQTGGSNVIVKIGNVLATDTHADLVASQFYEIDLGTFVVDEHWGSCLDYEPYTRATLYLPYANSINLDIDKIMGCTIGVKYHCDIVSGDFIGFITSNGQIINMVNGNLKTDIALSGTDYTQKSIATLQTVTGLASTIGGVATGNAMLMGMGASNVASGVMSSKPNYTQTGNFTGASGLMGLQYAYIVFERVDQCLPINYKAFNGYPSYITENLNNLSGFTKVSDIHLSILGALDDEVTELESLLKEGVIL